MLPRSQRLTSTQFDRAFAQSQTLRHPLVSVKVHFRGDEQTITRAAFVIPKKQAKKASQRNLIRRRLRERYRLNAEKWTPLVPGCDLIFMSTPQTGSASGEELDAALRELLERAGKRIPRNGSGGRGGERPKPVEIVAPQVEETESAPLSSPVQLALGLIRFYQRFISPGLPPSCRFEPTCSRYTYVSIERFGFFRGTALGAVRICKCHPWHEGGYDPVPQSFPDLLSKRTNKKKFSTRLFRSNHRDGASL